MSNLSIKLSNYISDNFKEVYSSIMNGLHNEVVLKGGRGSTKSSVACMCVILRTLTLQQSALVLIKYQNGIGTRLINIFIRYINALELSRFFRITPSKSCITLLDAHGKPSNIEILFSGCDDPEKLKSISPKVGNFATIWIEEASNFKDGEELRNATISFARGGGCVSIYSYNPPKNPTAWANTFFNEEKPSRLIHHSTYEDICKCGHGDWLGERFISDAEHLKATNPSLYEYMYLGKATGSGTEIFNDIHTFNYSEKIKEIGNELSWGLDYGHSIDPTCLIGCKYVAGINSVFICEELWVDYAIRDISLASKIKDKITQGTYFIYADSASPSRTNELAFNGVMVASVSKPKDSIRKGIEWLSKCSIYIDPIKCPNTFKEFTNYSFKVVRGNRVEDYPDKDNHSIDAVRYALADYINTINSDGYGKAVQI